MKYNKAAEFYYEVTSHKNGTIKPELLEQTSKASFKHLYEEFVKECMAHPELIEYNDLKNKYHVITSYNPDEIKEFSINGKFDEHKYNQCRAMAIYWSESEKNKIEEQIKKLENSKKGINFVSINKKINDLKDYYYNQERNYKLVSKAIPIFETINKFGLKELKNKEKEYQYKYGTLLSSIAYHIVRDNIDKYPAILVKDHIDYIIDKPILPGQKEVYNCAELISSIDDFKKELIEHLDEYLNQGKKVSPFISKR